MQSSGLESGNRVPDTNKYMCAEKNCLEGPRTNKFKGIWDLNAYCLGPWTLGPLG